MDLKLFIKEPEKKAKSLVRKITHSGETEQLDRESLDELKAILKSIDTDNIIIVGTFDECMKCLLKEHSQVRVATVKLTDYLFRKSHIFREKLLENFDIFLELTLAINQKIDKKRKLNLPPPKKYAQLLQELTAKFINSWHSDYALGYERLRYAYKYLREHQLVDFSQFRVQSHEEIIRRQKLAENQERILMRSIENRLKELSELKPETEKILAQIESLLEILVPDPEKLLRSTEDTQEGDPLLSDQTLQQKHGITNLSKTLQIEFDPYYEISKSKDNQEIVQTLKELKKELIQAKMTKLIAIEKTLMKGSEQFVSDLKGVIDLKNKCTNLIMKLGELKIINDLEDSNKSRNLTLDTVDSDSDSDFEDVEPKEGLETYIPKSMRFEYGLESINPKELIVTNKINFVDEDFNPKPSCSGLGSTMAITCNVKLENGKLCPRRDKVKCPFHGRIIARDHNGIPLDETARLKEEKRFKMRPSVPDWQDPQLLADIKGATGIDLTMPRRGVKKKTKTTKLVNTKTCDLTPKQRLERRLLSLKK